MVRIRPTQDGVVTVRLPAGKVNDAAGNGNAVSSDLVRQAGGVIVLTSAP
jgi:hypothetical protein